MASELVPGGVLFDAAAPDLEIRVFRDRHGLWVHGRPIGQPVVADVERSSAASVEVARLRVRWAEGQCDFREEGGG